MRPRLTTATLGLALAGLGAVLLLAGEPQFGRLLTEGPGIGLRASRLGDMAAPALLGAAAAAIAAFTLAARPRRRRKGEPEAVWVVEHPPTPWWGYALAAVMVAGLILGFYAALVRAPGVRDGAAALVSDGLATTADASRAPTAARRDPTGGGAAGEGLLSGGLAWAMLGLAGAAVAGAVALPAVARLRHRPGLLRDREAAPPVVPRNETASQGQTGGMDAAEFDRLVAAVAGTADARDAVIRAYHVLEAALAALKYRRPPPLTPAEHLANNVPPPLRGNPDAWRLVELYHEAAYGQSPTTGAERQEAVDLLRRLWNALREVPR